MHMKRMRLPEHSRMPGSAAPGGKALLFPDQCFVAAAHSKNLTIVIFTAYSLPLVE